MATNKELFIKLKKMSSPYLTDGVKKAILYEANGCDDLTAFIPHFGEECKDETYFNRMLDRVLKGEPVQYVIGKSQFLHLILNVTPDVLIPRVETEELAAIILDTLKETKAKHYNVADVCTGSGCLACAVKSRFPGFDVMATDIDEKALNVAKSNAKKYNLDIDFKQGDLIDPIIDSKKKIDVLICNPPYIGDKSTVDPQTWEHEPHLALMAEPAWKHYERIFQYYRYFMADEYIMFFEIGEDMEKDLTNIMNINMDDATFIFKKDLYGKTRFLIVSGVNKHGPDGVAEA